MPVKIESVDFFYLSMPEVLDIGDGSQDALLVRVRAGGVTGWGECEAAPLVSIASLVCPMSHSACKPVMASVLGQNLDDPTDIARIGRTVRDNSLDLLQADHTLAGIDIALWDLMGKKKGVPVFDLLGIQKSYPKTPYASLLFADTPEQTRVAAKALRAKGYRAIKFGWGPYGRTTAKADADQVHAAREGLGADGHLLVDAGTVWVDDVGQARQRLAALQACGAMWLEEPFVSGAIDAYAELSKESGAVKMAGGEGCHNFHMAKHMIDHAGLGFVQIDTGRIGGISDAKLVADYAAKKGVTYVNHTFTTHLALSASLQPFAGLEEHRICEYPVEAKPLAEELSRDRLKRDADGLVHAPEKPGLGVEPDHAAIKKYLVDAEIKVGGKVLYRTPEL
jgi:L-alanine-DL-glutamate epimerase-like enolase superfamily enzyme